MRRILMTLAAGTALIGAPAFAQPVGDTVEHVGDKAGEAVDSAKLTLATREQVRAGTEVIDTKGNSIGTVQSVDGDAAVVVKGGKLYDIPLSSLHHDAAGSAHKLVTKLAPDEIKARSAASAETGGAAR
jgi:hypothetical protein